MQCLKSISKVFIFGGYPMFNNEQSFGDGVAYRPHVYGLGIGKYQIINTFGWAPMAILNNDCSDNIIYNGNDKVTLTPGAAGYARQSEGYSFYTGTINVTVRTRSRRSEFEVISI